MWLSWWCGCFWQCVAAEAMVLMYNVLLLCYVVGACVAVVGVWVVLCLVTMVAGCVWGGW